MVTNDKIMMSSVLQILKNLVFKSSVLIIPQIMLIFSLQENTRGAPNYFSTIHGFNKFFQLVVYTFGTFTTGYCVSTLQLEK